MLTTDQIAPMTTAGIAQVTRMAEKYQYQRGAQGVWSRRWLQLMATAQSTYISADDSTRLARAGEAVRVVAGDALDDAAEIAKIAVHAYFNG